LVKFSAWNRKGRMSAESGVLGLTGVREKAAKEAEVQEAKKKRREEVNNAAKANAPATVPDENPP